MEDQNQKIQEMQMLEQNLQNLLMQKQSFQIELSETIAALKEVETSKEQVFKVIGQLMIQADKEKMKEELKTKEKVLDTRINAIEKQEGPLTEQLEKFREELMKGMDKK
jgi:prefoldin beta subunit